MTATLLVVAATALLAVVSAQFQPLSQQQQYPLEAPLPFGVKLLGVGSRQTLTITGRLLCNGRPMSGQLVKLYDNGIVWDSKMDQTKSDSNGNFVLSGSETGITSIDPKFNVYHTCEKTTFQVS